MAETGSLHIAPDERVFVLTGAGISAESGISTFRDAGGLWEKYRFEEVASPEAWAADPVTVWRFYSQRREQAKTCAPNPAHLALARLEEALGDRLFVCTQNVDPLHEAAGSTRVAHMHGELFKSRCEDPSCRTSPRRDDASYLVDDAAKLPRCTCGAKLRPHIVWFGEVPFEMGRIGAELSRADVFVTVGSSGAVYPAASFVRSTRARRKIYVGPERPDNAGAFTEIVLGKAGAVLPGLVG